MTRLLLVPLTVALAASQQTAPAQDPHAQMHARGAHVMGFDQTATIHHFLLYQDGGAIEVSVKDPKDTANRDAIRGHLPHITQMFQDGDFEAPMIVHDSTAVPGTAELARLKNTLTYQYVETAAGARVDVVTTDPAALKALHEFLRFQIKDHQTGDSGKIDKRK